MRVINISGPNISVLDVIIWHLETSKRDVPFLIHEMSQKTPKSFCCCPPFCVPNGFLEQVDFFLIYSMILCKQDILHCN